MHCPSEDSPGREGGTAEEVGICQHWLKGQWQGWDLTHSGALGRRAPPQSAGRLGLKEGLKEQCLPLWSEHHILNPLQTDPASFCTYWHHPSAGY